MPRRTETWEGCRWTRIDPPVNVVPSEPTVHQLLFRKKRTVVHDNSSTKRILCCCPDLLALKVSNAFPLVRRALFTFVAADLDANTFTSAASGPTITKRGKHDFRLEGSKRGA